MKFERFEDIPVWKSSLEATKLIYDITSKVNFSKDFWLRDQIRRAVISISSNIVEGYKKHNNNELIRYLRIAKWSCWEVRNQLHIWFAIWYITQEEFEESKNTFIELSKQIFWFMNYLENKRKESEFIRK